MTRVYDLKLCVLMNITSIVEPARTFCMSQSPMMGLWLFLLLRSHNFQNFSVWSSRFGVRNLPSWPGHLLEPSEVANERCYCDYSAATSNIVGQLGNLSKIVAYFNPGRRNSASRANQISYCSKLNLYSSRQRGNVAPSSISDLFNFSQKSMMMEIVKVHSVPCSFRQHNRRDRNVSNRIYKVECHAP